MHCSWWGGDSHMPSGRGDGHPRWSAPRLPASCPVGPEGRVVDSVLATGSGSCSYSACLGPLNPPPALCTAAVPVGASRGVRDKVPQTGWLTTTQVRSVQFWGPEGQDRGVGGTVFGPKPAGRHPLLASLPASGSHWPSLAPLGVVDLSPAFACVFKGPPRCVSVSSSFLLRAPGR